MCICQRRVWRVVMARGRKRAACRELFGRALSRRVFPLYGVSRLQNTSEWDYVTHLSPLEEYVITGVQQWVKGEEMTGASNQTLSSRKTSLHFDPTPVDIPVGD